MNTSHSRFHTILRLYERSSPWLKSFLTSAAIVLPLYGTAILSYWVKRGFDDKKILQFYSVATLAILFLYFLVLRYIEMRAEEAHRMAETQRRTIGQAHNFSDELVAERCEMVRESLHELQAKRDGTDLFESAVASVRQIRSIVERLYLVMESQYSKTEDYLNQVNFEVTFMTKSYKDGNITIIAWRNRDRRAPRSLILRESDPHIYDRTVTAEVYRAERPEMVIVEDTAQPVWVIKRTEPYEELYTGQKDRIRSSIIYPVLGDNNALLGTLVVHCDESRFFKKSDEKFWKALLEIYAKRIAYQKVCLDAFRSLDFVAWTGTINHPRPN